MSEKKDFLIKTWKLRVDFYDKLPRTCTLVIACWKVHDDDDDDDDDDGGDDGNDDDDEDDDDDDEEEEEEEEEEDVNSCTRLIQLFCLAQSLGSSLGGSLPPINKSALPPLSSLGSGRTLPTFKVDSVKEDMAHNRLDMKMLPSISTLEKGLSYNGD